MRSLWIVIFLVGRQPYNLKVTLSTNEVEYMTLIEATKRGNMVERSS